jgi:phosphohistidine phosphatase
VHKATLNDVDTTRQNVDMRYLMIVRHAKASAPLPMGLDFDRPLSGRGRKQCKQLRAWARDATSLGQYGPVTALVSSAVRTTETFELGFDGTDFVEQGTFDRSIYGGPREVTGEDLVQALREVDPLTTSLMIVGHNPAVHDLLFVLAREIPEELRTQSFALGGVYVLALPDGEMLQAQRYEVVASFIPDQKERKIAASP